MKNLLRLLLVLLPLINHANSILSTGNNRVDSLEIQLMNTNNAEKLDVLLELCECLVEKDSKKCMLYSRQALDLSRKLKQPDKEVKALIYLGREHSNLGDYFEGLQKFKEAQKLAFENGLDRSLVDAWNEIGITYFNIGNFEEAQNYYFKALKKAEKINYEKRIIGIKNNIAVICSIYKDYDGALGLFNNLLNIYENRKDSFHIALTLVNMSNIYDEIGEYEKSLQYLNKAIPVFTASGNNLELSSTLNNRGDVYLKMNRSDEAVADYWQGLKIAEENNYEDGIISSSISIGEYFVNEKQYNKALNFFNSTLKIALGNQNKMHIIECYEGLAKAYTLSGNHKMALDNMKLFISCKDEIYNEKKQKQISELHIKYETEKKEENIEYLQFKIRNQKRNLAILIAGLILISLLILRILHLKQVSLKRRNLILEQEKQMDKLALEKIDAEKREKDLENLRLSEELQAKEEINRLKQLKYEAELKHKERELAANALQMVSKNETLSSFKKLAEDALLAKNSGVRTALKKLIQEIDNNIHLDQDWDKFKIHFEEVHQGFFKNLLEKCPELNTNELRFCAYLRLKLDTKEIARILNISVNAIEKRRYRLRKKLSLNSTDNLYEFLRKF